MSETRVITLAINSGHDESLDVLEDMLEAVTSYGDTDVAVLVNHLVRDEPAPLRSSDLLANALELGMFPDLKIKRAPDFNVATERTGIDEDQMSAPPTLRNPHIHEEFEEMQEAFNAAINFSLDEADGEGICFMRMWREGDWNGIRAEFPEFKSTVLD
jgi:hypothetical protein